MDGHVKVLARVLLYARTVRHLRWEQWWYRALRFVPRQLPPPRPDQGEWQRAPGALGEEVRAWGPRDDGTLQRAREVVDGTFRFLNRAHTLRTIDWNARRVSHLWSYNLHYFDYAVDLARAYRSTGERRYARRFAELADDWIESTEPGKGDGWEPYPTSLRIVNWLYALLLLQDAVEEPTRSRIEESLVEQLHFLAARLELHLLANHLQKNVKALVLGGLYFDGRAPAAWRRRGLRLLWRELLEQVLPDGAQYERSPMYHAIALADYLELFALLRSSGESIPDSARKRVEAMVLAFGVLARPSGSLHLFNDAANGIAPQRDWLDRMARRVLGRHVPVKQGQVSLPQGGFYGYVGPGERLLVDCGEPGPSYQPGHAHCGLLGFELDVDRRPLVVDSGVSGYGDDPLREYVRSTRAHNTITIDGKDQSEVWGTFRVAGRARLLNVKSGMTPGGYVLEAAYAPYHDRHAMHSRRIRGGSGHWQIVDRVRGARGARLTSYLHVHPDWTIEPREQALVARCGKRVVRIEPFGFDRITIVEGRRDPVQGWYCPEFGKAVAAPVLVMTIDQNDSRESGYAIERMDAIDG